MEVSGIIMSGIVYAIVLLIAFCGLMYLEGWIIDPRIQGTVKEFVWENHPVHVMLRFESDDGIFVTGKVIHVKSLLYYPTKTNQNEVFSLYFPNTLTPNGYNKLVDDKQWSSYSNGSAIVISRELLYPENETFTGMPSGLFTTFDTVWTQEGLHDGYVIIRNSSDNTVSGNMTLDKMINIEPEDALQNMKTTNTIAGLTFVIISFTLATAYSQYDRLFIYLKWKR